MALLSGFSLLVLVRGAGRPASTPGVTIRRRAFKTGAGVAGAGRFR